MSIIKAAVGLELFPVVSYLGGLAAHKIIQKNPKSAAKIVKKLLETGVSDGIIHKALASGKDLGLFNRWRYEINRGGKKMYEHLFYSLSPSARGLGDVYDKGYKIGLSGKADGIMKRVVKNGEFKRFAFDGEKLTKKLDRIESYAKRGQQALKHPSLAALAPGVGGAGIGAVSAGEGNRTKGAITGGAIGFSLPYASLKYGVTRPAAKKVLSFDSKPAFSFVREVLK